MAANTFTAAGATTVAFSLPPAPGYRVQRIRNQPRAVSLGGRFYLYDRGCLLVRHTLTFKKTTAAARVNLHAFFDTITRGGRSVFTWNDQDDTPHSVRLSGDIESVEAHPGRFTVTLTLEEIL